MGLPRKTVLGGDASGHGQWVHCISRCVRRAFLCGDGLEHRKDYIEQRLELITRYAAVETAAYAVMSNHLHVVFRIRRDVADEWTDYDVARRWLTLFPRKSVVGGSTGKTGDTGPSEEDIVAAARGSMVGAWRMRLADLGWVMKGLKENLSKKFNREDRCTGAFWEGRYKSVLLADQAALIACMAYVDMNPIRAKMADRPEDSLHTSIRKRILARQGFVAASQLKGTKQNDKAGQTRSECGLSPDAKHMEDGLWLTPLARCTVRPSKTLNGLAKLNDDGSLSGPVEYGCRITPEEYMKLVDATGRILRGDKRGSIPAELEPILARLDIQVNDWLKTMLGWRQFMGRLIGSAATRVAAATEHGLKWIQNRCDLFGPKQKQPAKAAG